MSIHTTKSLLFTISSHTLRTLRYALQRGSDEKAKRPPETWMTTNSLDFLETGFFWSIAGAATIVAVLVLFPALTEE